MAKGKKAKGMTAKMMTMKETTLPEPHSTRSKTKVTVKAVNTADPKPIKPAANPAHSNGTLLFRYQWCLNSRITLTYSSAAKKKKGSDKFVRTGRGGCTSEK